MDELIGMDRLQAALKASPAIALAAVGGSLYREGQRIMADSEREVPVDLGALKNSGTVFEPVVDAMSVSVTLGYGGAAEAYAVIQHENVHFRHHGNQKAHYLSDPVHDHAVGFDARLAADLDAVDFFPGVA